VTIITRTCRGRTWANAGNPTGRPTTVPSMSIAVARKTQAPAQARRLSRHEAQRIPLGSGRLGGEFVDLPHPLGVPCQGHGRPDQPERNAPPAEKQVMRPHGARGGL
jgi:hypothetical protein